jgi:hypothetical protein
MANEMAQAERKKVKIACRIPNGIMIALWKPGFDDGTGDGVKPTIRDGAAIRLRGPSGIHTGVNATEGHGLLPGLTEVDEEWWGKWWAANPKNPFVVDKMIYLHDPEQEKTENPTP